MKINAHRAHIKLWTWLAKYPGFDKCDWPEWEKNGGTIEATVLFCFACEITDDCNQCPLQWPRRLTCEPSADSLYNKWVHAEDMKKRSRYARQIANLKWKGRKIIEV